MKQFNTLFFCLCVCLFGTQLTAQRYLTETFDAVDVQTNIMYGANYTVLSVPQTGNTALRPLMMDLYTPAGDTETERPLVVLFGTGNFLPQGVNGGVYGTRMDSVNVETAMRLAKLGYVVAIADYRSGWDPLSDNLDVRVSTLINAAYRGQHDARAAIRFFQKTIAQDGNPYGVCGDKITIWGIGTGGYVALATGYLDVYEDVLIPKFFGTDANGNVVPFVIEDINGNVEGNQVRIFPQIDGNPLSGDTLNIPNNPEFSSEVQLVVNVAGALGDSSWIDANDPPLIGFHVPLDPNAPYMTDVLTVPTTGDLIVEVSGSFDAVRIANELGINDVLGDDMIDDAFTTAANSKNNGVANLFPYENTVFTNALGMMASEGDPYNWWDGPFWSQVPFVDAAGDCRAPLPANLCNFDFVTGLGHAVNSADESRAVIDTTINYFAPRAFNALNLGEGCSFVNTDNLPAAVAQLTATPNPAREAITISTGSEMLMRTVSVFDLQGRLISMRRNVNTQQIVLERNQLPAGMYYVRVQFDEGLATQRVVFE